MSIHFQPAAMARQVNFYQSIAGDEQITVEQVHSTLYVFGSELATLRIFAKMKNGRVGYSSNLQTFSGPPTCRSGLPRRL